MKNTCTQRQNQDIMHNILPVGEGVHRPTACIISFFLNLCICHTDDEKKKVHYSGIVLATSFIKLV